MYALNILIVSDVHNNGGEFCFRRWGGVEERDTAIHLGEIEVDVPWLLEDTMPIFL